MLFSCHSEPRSWIWSNPRFPTLQARQTLQLTHPLPVSGRTARWSAVSCAASRFYETPHIDRFATESVRFTQAYAACHVCSPTRASILTGKYPARLHLTDYIPGGNDRRLHSPD